MIRLIIILITGTLISMLPVFSENLISNPGMEIGDTKPAGWRFDEYNPDGSIVKIEKKEAHSGNKSVSIENTIFNDARLTQLIVIEENTNYKITGWIKTDTVSNEGRGANISFLDHPFTIGEIKGTHSEWKYNEFYLTVLYDIKTVTFAIRLGGYAGESTGKAFFDDISMEKATEIPAGKRVFTIGSSRKRKSENIKNTTDETDEVIEIIPESGNRPPPDSWVRVSNVIVYSLVFLSLIIFCIQLMIIKPRKTD